MVSEGRLRFAVDYIRSTGVLHRERPPDVELMPCLMMLAHAYPREAVLTEAAVREPENLANIGEVIAEVFWQERLAAKLN